MIALTRDVMVADPAWPAGELAGRLNVSRPAPGHGAEALGGLDAGYLKFWRNVARSSEITLPDPFPAATDDEYARFWGDATYSRGWMDGWATARNCRWHARLLRWLRRSR